MKKLVKEYIKTAQPVSSDLLKLEYFVDISPATIRIELAELTYRGFLEKPYVSGGRVPTDKGYRFFVDQLPQPKHSLEKRFNDLFSQLANTFNLAQRAASLLAENSSNLGMAYFEDLPCWKEGWQDLALAPEFENINYWRGFLKMVTELEQQIPFIVKENQTSEVQVFIGQEFPCHNKDFSLIFGEGWIGSNKSQRAVFTIAGPKRMDFHKNISLMNSLIEALS